MTYGPRILRTIIFLARKREMKQSNDLLDFLVASKYYDGVLTLYKLIIKPNRLGLIYGPTHDLLNDTSPKAE